jgi:hypothetical protein
MRSEGWSVRHNSGSQGGRDLCCRASPACGAVPENPLVNPCLAALAVCAQCASLASQAGNLYASQSWPYRRTRQPHPLRGPASALWGVALWVHCPWLDLQPIGVVLHLLICNGEIWNLRLPSRAKPPSRNPFANILVCSQVIGLNSSCIPTAV